MTEENRDRTIEREIRLQHEETCNYVIETREGDCKLL